MYHLIKKIALISAVVFTVNNASASEIIAYVNDDVITSIDLEQSMQILSKSEGRHFSSNEQRAAFIEEMIDTTLLLDFCKKQRLNVDENEVAATIGRMAAQNNMELDAFYEMLKDQGINKKSFHEYLHNKLIVTSFDNTFILPKIQIETKDININRRRVTEDLVMKSKQIKRVDVEEIIIYKNQVGEEVYAQLIENIEKYIEENTFASTAATYSNSATAESGGKVGWVEYNEMSPIYQTLLTTSLTNHSAEIYHTDDALLVLKANDVEYENTLTKENINDAMIEHYLKIEEAELKRAEFIAKLRKKAFINIIAHK